MSEMEITEITWEQGLEVAGQFEIDNAIRIITETVGDRQLISGGDVADIIDSLLDRRNVLGQSSSDGMGDRLFED